MLVAALWDRNLNQLIDLVCCRSWGEHYTARALAVKYLELGDDWVDPVAWLERRRQPRHIVTRQVFDHLALVLAKRHQTLR